MDKIQLTEEHKARMRLWVAALRGGDYAQGRNHLASRRAGGNVFEYCCMGVGCEVAIHNGAPVRVEVKSYPLALRVASSDIVALKKYDDNSVLMPYSVAQWYGLDRGLAASIWDPMLWYPKQEDSVPLSQLNDDFLLPFDRIAELMEREYDL